MEWWAPQRLAVARCCHHSEAGDPGQQAGDPAELEQTALVGPHQAGNCRDTLLPPPSSLPWCLPLARSSGSHYDKLQNSWSERTHQCSWQLTLKAWPQLRACLLCISSVTLSLSCSGQREMLYYLWASWAWVQVLAFTSCVVLDHSLQTLSLSFPRSRAGDDGNTWKWDYWVMVLEVWLMP